MTIYEGGKGPVEQKGCLGRKAVRMSGSPTKILTSISGCARGHIRGGGGLHTDGIHWGQRLLLVPHV